MIESLGLHDLLLFVTAGLLLNITPGADMLYVAGHAAAGGRRGAVQAALGIGAGCLVHVALATLGVAALIASSPVAFQALKWAGAGYLLWMGLGMWRSRGGAPASAAAVAPGRVFWRGVLTNALNPKVAIFFLAFLPQFISPQAEHKAFALALLGLVFTVNGTLVTLVFAWVAGSARDRVAGAAGAASSRAALWLRRAAGGLFIGLGLKLAFDPR